MPTQFDAMRPPSLPPSVLQHRDVEVHNRSYMETMLGARQAGLLSTDGSRDTVAPTVAAVNEHLLAKSFTLATGQYPDRILKTHMMSGNLAAKHVILQHQMSLEPVDESGVQAQYLKAIDAYRSAYHSLHALSQADADGTPQEPKYAFTDTALDYWSTYIKLMVPTRGVFKHDALTQGSITVALGLLHPVEQHTEALEARLQVQVDDVKGQLDDVKEKMLTQQLAVTNLSAQQGELSAVVGNVQRETNSLRNAGKALLRGPSPSAPPPGPSISELAGDVFHVKRQLAKQHVDTQKELTLIRDSATTALALERQKVGESLDMSLEGKLKPMQDTLGQHRVRSEHFERDILRRLDGFTAANTEIHAQYAQRVDRLEHLVQGQLARLEHRLSVVEQRSIGNPPLGVLTALRNEERPTGGSEHYYRSANSR